MNDIKNSVGVEYNDIYYKIFSIANLNRAIKQVHKNKGAPGADGVTTKRFYEHFYNNDRNLLELSQYLQSKGYRHQPVRRVYIPKDDGSKRPLGIPCVIDRVLQQATAQVLAEIYEPQFSSSSFGFRPNKSAHQAIGHGYNLIKAGYLYVIDMDLAKFFDTVDHNKLLEVIYRKIPCNRLRNLIRKFLQAPIRDGNKTSPSLIGTPQGGPVSPILANILLNELDQLLDSRGVKFARYADDMLIFAKSPRSMNRIYRSVKRYVEQELRLTINETKTKLGRINSRYKFLGHAYRKRPKSDPKFTTLGEWGVTVHQKSRDKCIKILTDLTHRSCRGGYVANRTKLRRFITGWFNYYQYTYRHFPNWFNTTDSFLRRRIRAMLWRQLKSPQERRKVVQQFAPKRVDKIGYSGKHNHVKSKSTLNQVFRDEILEQLGYVWFSIANKQCLERRNKAEEKSKTSKRLRRKKSIYEKGLGLLPRPYILRNSTDNMSDDEIMKTLEAVGDMANYFVNEFLYM